MEAPGEVETAHLFQYGCFVGKAFRLQRFLATPCAARDGPLEWAQSMGKVVITYELPGDIDTGGLSVEMNRWQLKVSTLLPSGKRQPLPEMTRDLRHTVRSLHSYWSIDEEEPQRALVVVLTKQDHLAWKELWKPDAAGVTIFRKSPFVHSIAQWATSTDDRWTVLPQGVPLGGARAEMEKPYRFFPKKLCIGAHDEELHGARSASIFLLLDSTSLQYLNCFLPLEEALMAEVEATTVRVWLKFEMESGAYVQLFEAELATECLPELSTWAVTWRRSLDPVGDFNALQVSLVLREDLQQGRLVRRVRHAADCGAPDEIKAIATAVDT